MTACRYKATIPGATLMPRKLPPHVERNHVKGKTYLSFRIGKGPRIRLPDDPRSEEFQEAYRAVLLGQMSPDRQRKLPPALGTIAALIVSYMKSGAYLNLRATTKRGYASRIEALRAEHGHRAVSGLTRERIEAGILARYHDRPGAALSLLKMLRVLIHHAMSLDDRNPLKLRHDPSAGIKRPKAGEIRAWTDAETAAFERRWPLESKERTAYALMLYVGAARADVYRMTWRQIDEITSGVTYTRSKTGVSIEINLHQELRRALEHAARDHVTILNTAFGRPFTAAGFSQFMRHAIKAAGLPIECKPHGLRKTLGRRLADDGATAHQIMAVLGHTTLTEAERYTREADRRRGGREAIAKLKVRAVNSQTSLESLGKIQKEKEKP
jgi:enterobacteria phage integrase